MPLNKILSWQYNTVKGYIPFKPFLWVKISRWSTAKNGAIKRGAPLLITPVILFFICPQPGLGGNRWSG
jgi:hypothetical protein